MYHPFISSIERADAIRNSARSLTMLLLCAVILVWPAIYNGYPIMFADSAAYVQGAIEGFFNPRLGGPPAYAYFRPYTYSFVITDIRSIFGFWGIVYVQALITAFLIRTLLVDVFSRGSRWATIAVVTFIAVFSSISWHVSTVMPDMFASTLAISLFVLAFSRSIPAWKYLLVFAISIVSASVHYSHLPLSLAFVALLLVLSVFGGRIGILFRDALPLVFIPTLTAIILCSLNYQAFRVFSINPYGMTSIFSHLVANGTVGEVLQESCGSSTFSLCRDVSRLPPASMVYSDFDRFLWDPKSPFNELGGPAKLEPEMNALVKRALVQHPFQFLKTSFRDGLDEMFSLRTGGLNDLGNPDQAKIMNASLSWVDPGALRSFNNSRQGNLRLGVPKWVLWGTYVVWYLSLLVVVVAIAMKKCRFGLRMFMGFVVLFWMANAFLCGAVAEVQSRFNTRVVWLIPLCAAVLIVDVFHASRLRHVEAARSLVGTRAK